MRINYSSLFLTYLIGLMVPVAALSQGLVSRYGKMSQLPATTPAAMQPTDPVCQWLDAILSPTQEGSLLLRKGTCYYLSPNGDDTNPGTSPNQAWRSIAKVNATDFKPGDWILFEGGQTFSGNLYFDASDSSTTANPIVVSSYGWRRATIDAGTGTALFVYNLGGFRINNLIVKGSGGETNRGSGISFYNDLANGVKLEHLRIQWVDVSGFRYSGIQLGAYPEDASKSGYRDVQITFTDVHDNFDAGISSYGYYSNGTIPGYAHQQVYVGHCRAYRNTGIANKGNNSGNGIVLSDVDGGIIERCVAHDNGINNNNPGGGPVGIWAWESNNITIQYNESYANRSSTIDGGGFDLDGGVTNSVMQYNYSHNNDGAGYLLYQFYSARPFYNNIVRYNISENDGRRGAYGGIYTGGGVQDIEVYHNTIFVSAVPGADPRPVRLEEGTGDVRLRNNIFVTTGGAPLLNVVASASDVVFQGNDYWTSGDTFIIQSADTTYNNLNDWRAATGQETYNASPTGLSADPQLVAPGQGGTIGNPYLLFTLKAYKLRSDSPLIDAGLDLPALFGLSVGKRDFYGNPVPRERTYDVSAHEGKSDGRQTRRAAPVTVVPSADPGSLRNYPNPFKGKTVIEYILPQPSRVKLEVYDAFGHRVALLAEGEQTAGYQRVNFTGEHLRSGVYFCRLTVGSRMQVKKMLLQ